MRLASTWPASRNTFTVPLTARAKQWNFGSPPSEIWLQPAGFLERAINLHDLPEKITIDKSGANTAAIESVKRDACLDIVMRQSKCLNNIARQDHQAIKRITRPMLGLKYFWSAQTIIGAIETMHMIKKGQMDCPAGSATSAANQFYSLAA